MQADFQQWMADATRLTRGGDLQAATAAIQAALAGTLPGRAEPPPPTPAGSDAFPPVIDVVARDIPAQGQQADVAAGEARRSAAGGDRFIAGSYGSGTSARSYKLYIPPAAGAEPRPLIVMLHGCTQNPDDFAAGTSMNGLARAGGFFVLYPAQSQKANPQRCWNWFKHSHQAPGRGEPAILAAMTREVMKTHGIDPSRVYVAGLSAGGAMAAILGDGYPELYAAVGVHSGLPTGLASDLPSALGAMKSGPPSATHTRPGASGVPTIVFHGDADGTVHPANGVGIVAASVGEGARVEVERRQAPGGRSYTRHVHHADGRGAIAEHWVVHGSPHAWSGGTASGSYTDPRGPDASAEMVRFFLAHPRSPRH
jgi:poly(hydroxyalkanoate) depolymerase family esterase